LTYQSNDVKVGRMASQPSWRQREVLLWGVLLFGLSALGTIPFFAFVPDLSKFTGNLPPAKLAVLGLGVELTAVAPSLAAILVAWRVPSAGGARALFAQIKRWRVHPLWYGIALLLPVPLLLAGNVIWLALGKQSLVWLTVPSAIPFTIGAALVPPIGEEFGWRGFAQLRLQRRTGALWAAIIVGSLWSTWHLWPLAVPGGAKLFLPSDVVQTYIRLISTAVIYAWIYNSTRGSLPAVMIAHAANNIDTSFIPGPSVDPTHLGPFIGSLLYAVAAIVVVLATNRRTLTRSAQLALPPLPPGRVAIGGDT
jgi:membrane protease YdiL (CAAX protease family)